MSGDDGYEPVFRKSRWGTNRYEYNPDNPVGMALIVLAVLVLIGGLYYLHDSSEWSRDELHDATTEAAAALEKEPHVSDDSLGYDMLIEDAIDRTGEGPSFGARVEREDTHETRDYDDYTVTGSGTDAAFCMRIAEIPHGDEVMLRATVTDGACGGF
ncbi:hypothetical protein ACWCP6_06530 [Streptomyces sp. NPDC002004]